MFGLPISAADAVGGIVREIKVHAGRGELRFVEEVEEVHAELQGEPLLDLEILVDREVGVGNSGS